MGSDIHTRGGEGGGEKNASMCHCFGDTLAVAVYTTYLLFTDPAVVDCSLSATSLAPSPAVLKASVYFMRICHPLEVPCCTCKSESPYFITYNHMDAL